MLDGRDELGEVGAAERARLDDLAEPAEVAALDAERDHAADAAAVDADRLGALLELAGDGTVRHWDLRDRSAPAASRRAAPGWSGSAPGHGSLDGRTGREPRQVLRAGGSPRPSAIRPRARPRTPALRVSESARRRSSSRTRTNTVDGLRGRGRLVIAGLDQPQRRAERELQELDRLPSRRSRRSASGRAGAPIRCGGTRKMRAISWVESWRCSMNWASAIDSANCSYCTSSAPVTISSLPVLSVPTNSTPSPPGCPAGAVPCAERHPGTRRTPPGRPAFAAKRVGVLAEVLREPERLAGLRDG